MFLTRCSASGFAVAFVFRCALACFPCYHGSKFCRFHLWVFRNASEFAVVFCMFGRTGVCLFVVVVFPVPVLIYLRFASEFAVVL